MDRVGGAAPQENLRNRKLSWTKRAEGKHNKASERLVSTEGASDTTL